MADVTLKQLEYFVTTADAGSVTAAAARLFISQSAVSTALSDLEELLGTQVFVRRPRGIALTLAGRDLLADARQILMSVESMRDSARSSADSLTGQLRVGCYSTLAPVLLPMAIDEFLRRHPQVDLSFVEGSHVELIERLLRGELDLAIVYDYGISEVRQNREILLNRVHESVPYVLMPQDHPLADRQQVALHELVDDPMILFDLSPGGEYFLSFFEQAGLSPHVRFRTTSFEVVRSMVARGLGYSILSQRTGISMSYEGRVFATARLAADIPALGIATAQLQRVQPTARVRSFIEQVRSSLDGWTARDS
jgi:DNA-binding transcriptional LysR family regulator